MNEQETWRAAARELQHLQEIEKRFRDDYLKREKSVTDPVSRAVYRMQAEWAECKRAVLAQAEGRLLRKFVEAGGQL